MKLDNESVLEKILEFEGQTWHSLAHSFNITTKAFEKWVYEEGNKKVINAFDVLKEKVQSNLFNEAVKSRNTKVIEGLSDTLDIYNRVDKVEQVEFFWGKGYDDWKKVNFVDLDDINEG